MTDRTWLVICAVAAALCVFVPIVAMLLIAHRRDMRRLRDLHRFDRAGTGRGTQIGCFDLPPRRSKYHPN